MTYDYRFAGDEKLRCNCGAPTCRGWVNMPTGDSPYKRADGSMYLPCRELVGVRGHAGDAPAAVQRLTF